MSQDEKWAANIAFVGDKETVREILQLINNLEEQGKIEDYTGIDGPFDSLQEMLKRRVENLALESTEKSSPNQASNLPSLQNKTDDKKVEE